VDIAPASATATAGTGRDAPVVPNSAPRVN